MIKRTRNRRRWGQPSEQDPDGAAVRGQRGWAGGLGRGRGSRADGEPMPMN